MSFKSLALAGAMTAALSVLAPNAEADIISFDFSSGGTNTGFQYGNTRTFTTSGLTVTITSWALSLQSWPSDKFESAYTGQYGSGLGICNRDEYCGDPQHTASNTGVDEYFLIQFSTAVDPQSVDLKAFGDTDISYWTGSLTPAGIDGKTLAQVQTAIGSAELTDDGGTSSRIASLTSGNVTALFIGARNGGNDQDDRFKLDGITVDRPNTRVPEPASMALLGASLLGLGALRRRR